MILKFNQCSDCFLDLMSFLPQQFALVVTFTAKFNTLPQAMVLEAADYNLDLLLKCTTSFLNLIK